MNRRSFIRGIAAAGAFPLLPGCFSAGKYAANSKVRLAFCGIGQQGWYDIQQFRLFPQLFDVVALCDTDMEAEHTLECLKAYPDVPRFRDFRKMFDELGGGIDACLVAVPDHSHFPIAMEAMRRGVAVYVEKPLAHTFEECELMRAAAAKYGVVTQMGNQGHSTVKYHQFKEYVETGLIHDVYKVNVHMNNSRRWHKWEGKLTSFPKAEKLPATLDWDTWLGTASFHDYSRDFVGGEWRAWYDFGNGCMGDWGAHLLDCVHQFLLKGDLPSEIRVLSQNGSNKFVYPMNSTLQFVFPENRLHDELTLNWYEGASNPPPLPAGFVYAVPDGIPKSSANDEAAERRQKLFPGKEMYQRDGMIWQSLSHKHPLHVVGDYERKLPDYPPEFCTHYEGFLRAVRGEMETLSPFEIAAPLSQLFTLACIAQRLGRSLKFDASTGGITGDHEANALLKGSPGTPRKGWEEYYRV
ncbi:MAG: Gfo/Idh/MocA family oxidoreductase [Kiritimatiellae bacterium]|nr:Gfo/Idh/MocA family oxidoreductase [Kiritimatiellia bacterium]